MEIAYFRRLCLGGEISCIQICWTARNSEARGWIEKCFRAKKSFLSLPYRLPAFGLYIAKHPV